MWVTFFHPILNEEVWLFLEKKIMAIFFLIADTQLIPSRFTSSLCSTASPPGLLTAKSQKCFLKANC